MTPGMKSNMAEITGTNKYGITKDTLIGDLIDKYPFIKSELLNLSPEIKNNLSNPILFRVMKKVANLSIVAAKASMDVDELIVKLVGIIDSV